MKVFVVLALFGAVANASPFISFGGSLGTVNSALQAGVNKSQQVNKAFLGLTNIGFASPLETAKKIVGEGFDIGKQAVKFGTDAAKAGINVGKEIADKGLEVAGSLGLDQVASAGKKMNGKIADIATAGVNIGKEAAEHGIDLGNRTTQAVIEGLLSANGNVHSAMHTGVDVGHALTSNVISAGINQASQVGQSIGQTVANAGNQMSASFALQAEETDADSDSDEE